MSTDRGYVGGVQMALCWITVGELVLVAWGGLRVRVRDGGGWSERFAEVVGGDLGYVVCLRET